MKGGLRELGKEMMMKLSLWAALAYWLNELRHQVQVWLSLPLP
jgi:hypothetical protein